MVSPKWGGPSSTRAGHRQPDAGPTTPSCGSPRRAGASVEQQLGRRRARAFRQHAVGNAQERDSPWWSRTRPNATSRTSCSSAADEAAQVTCPLTTPSAARCRPPADQEQARAASVRLVHSVDLTAQPGQLSQRTGAGPCRWPGGPGRRRDGTCGDPPACNLPGVRLTPRPRTFPACRRRTRAFRRARSPRAARASGPCRK